MPNSKLSPTVQTFDFQSHALRIISDEHSELWFVAKDVADALDYSDAHKMCEKLDDDEKSNREIGGLGSPTGGRGTLIINESGLYSSILRSTKPEAKAFKKWVTAEVLPSLRKNGAYFAPNSALAQLQTLLTPKSEALSLPQFEAFQSELKNALEAVSHETLKATPVAMSAFDFLAKKTIQPILHSPSISTAETEAILNYFNDHRIEATAREIYEFKRWTNVFRGRKNLLDVFERCLNEMVSTGFLDVKVKQNDGKNVLVYSVIGGVK